MGLLYLFTLTFMSFHLCSHFLPVLFRLLMSLFSCRCYSHYLFTSVCDRPPRSIFIFPVGGRTRFCMDDALLFAYTELDRRALQRNVSSRLWINTKISSVFNYLFYLTRLGRAASHLPPSSVRAKNGRISTCTLSRVLMACQKLNVYFDCKTKKDQIRDAAQRAQYFNTQLWAKTSFADPGNREG